MSTKSEKIVRSILQSEFKKPIEDIVQIRSNVQALGNLVFTKAILLAAECGSLPDEIVTQSFIHKMHLHMHALRVCHVAGQQSHKTTIFANSTIIPGPMSFATRTRNSWSSIGLPLA